jgi:hypothetical protein
MNHKTRLPVPIAIAIITVTTLAFLFFERPTYPIPLWSRVLGLMFVAVGAFIYFRTNKKKDD